jgi:hypothetical protein
MFSSRPFRSDKYVTRAEYEQLKTRVDQLEFILRNSGAGHVHIQPSMGSAPTLPPGAGPSNPSYGHHSRSTSGSYGPGHGYGSDPYSVNARHPVTTLPPSSRTILSGEINHPAPEREISSSRQYHAPHRPVSRQSRSTLGPVTAVPSYGSTEGTDERPKKRSAWTQQGVRPRKSCRVVDLVRQSQLCNILLPFLFLLARIITHPLTLRLPPLAAPPQSSRWKSLPMARPSIGPLHQEPYGIVGPIVIHTTRCLPLPNASEMAGSDYNHPLPLVINDPCQISDTRRAGFLGLGSIIRFGVRG